MKIEITEVGEIVDIKKDVITIRGLPNCVYGELLDFTSGDKGLVIEFDQEKVVALLIGSGIETKTGDKVTSKGELLKIPVTEDLKGRITSALAQPLDGKGPIKSSEFGPVFRDAPPIMSRVPINESLKKAGVKKENLDAIAVATGPGLITSLQIGVETAKTLSYALNIPVIPINHIEGHMYANWIGKYHDQDIKYPIVVLTVSGGHTMLILMEQLLRPVMLLKRK